MNSCDVADQLRSTLNSQLITSRDRAAYFYYLLDTALCTLTSFGSGIESVSVTEESRTA